MKAWMIFVMINTVSLAATAQEGRFIAEAGQDTVFYGNPVEVSFICDNLKGEFVPPAFKQCKAATMLGRSSNYSFSNGRATSKLVYRYYIEPGDTGRVLIEPAELHDGQNIYKTDTLEIFVIPGPGVENRSKLLPGSKGPDPLAGRKIYKI